MRFALHALSRDCHVWRAACSRLSAKMKLWCFVLLLSRVPRVSLQFGNQQAMASADHVAEATRVAIDGARALDAQLRMLTYGPRVADVHDNCQSVLLPRRLPRIHLAPALCITMMHIWHVKFETSMLNVCLCVSLFSPHVSRFRVVCAKRFEYKAL